MHRGEAHHAEHAGRRQAGEVGRRAHQAINDEKAERDRCRMDVQSAVAVGIGDQHAQYHQQQLGAHQGPNDGQGVGHRQPVQREQF